MGQLEKIAVWLDWMEFQDSSGCPGIIMWFNLWFHQKRP